MDFSKFKSGDRVYTLSGNEVMFISEFDSQALVQQVFQTDEEERFGKPILVREVFLEEPVHKWSKKIDVLNEEIVELQKKRDVLIAEIRAANSTEKERKERLMQHRALTRIDDFLAGKFTHFVYYQYGVNILSFDEAIRYKESEYDRAPNRTRLLCLYGKADGDLEWGLHRYSDGSGSPEWVIPCVSLEDAQAIARDKLNLEFENWREKKGDYKLNQAVNDSIKLGFPIPEDAAIAVRAAKLNSLAAARDKAKLDYEKAEVALAEVK